MLISLSQLDYEIPTFITETTVCTGQRSSFTSSRASFTCGTPFITAKCVAYSYRFTEQQYKHQEKYLGLIVSTVDMY